MVDKAGKKAIVLDAMEEANHILLYDQKETPALHLWVSEGEHSIGVLNETLQTAVSLVSRENGNGISIHDKAGKAALNLFVTQTPMGNGISVGTLLMQRELLRGPPIPRPLSHRCRFIPIKRYHAIATR